MNEKLRRVLVNSGYAVVSNLLSLLVSALVVLVLPKVIGVNSYGYWQLYLFYVSYIGFFHLGWIDGIYLKYGGAHFDKLDKSNFFSQFLSYAIFQTLIAIVIFVFGQYISINNAKKFIFSMLSWTLLFTNLRFFIIYILQTTNRIKQSSMITILDRLAYFILLMGLIILGAKNFHIMIYADIFTRLISLIYGMFLCRNILIRPINDFSFDLKEILDNIKVGSSLMISNIASLLIIGTVRLGIEHQWDIVTFGKVSLALSISNLVMTFINAVGIVIFPLLRRIKKEKLPILYIFLRNSLMALMLLMLVFYYPLKIILGTWLPHYQESLRYMALVFPLSIFEGKMALLVNTYLKALRMEKVILRANILTVGLSFFLTILTTMVFKNVELAIGSIVLLLMFRCFIAEYLLSKRLKIDIIQNAIIEIAMSTLFIFSSWNFSVWYSALIYSISYIIYLIFKSKSFKSGFKTFKSILNDT